jgi:serine/threonine-protein kinase
MEEGTSPVKEGDVLAGKYRIERVLGVGGMGVVVAARHLQLDQRVALKFLHPEALASKDVVARFAREARAAAKIQSEHVARVVDVGTLETGSPYMVMEYLEGRDLDAVIEERGAIPPEESVGYVLQACEAIAEAHAAGIVHRDLKPANLFLAVRADKRSIIKVLDFGISKATGKSEDVSLTRTSTVMGSPLYMSPEQMASAKRVDQRSDIWALGVILYELVTGVPPFVAESMTEVIASILMHQPAPPSSVDVPPELTKVIQRCLEKEPAKRFQNVAELAAALAPFAASEQQKSVERVTRVLGSTVRMEARPSSPPSGLAPTARAPLVSDAGASRPSVRVGNLAPEAAAKLAIAKTHASWGKTGDEPVPSAAGKAKMVGGIVAVSLVAVVSMAGLVAFRKPAPAPVAAAAPDPPPVAPTVSGIVPAVAPPASLVAAAPGPSVAPPAVAPDLAPPPVRPPTAHPASPRPGPPPRASAAPAAPAPAPTATAKNPLQIDLK